MRDIATERVKEERQRGRGVFLLSAPVPRLEPGLSDQSECRALGGP